MPRPNKQSEHLNRLNENARIVCPTPDHDVNNNHEMEWNPNPDSQLTNTESTNSNWTLSYKEASLELAQFAINLNISAGSSQKNISILILSILEHCGLDKEEIDLLFSRMNNLQKVKTTRSHLRNLKEIGSDYEEMLEESRGGCQIETFYDSYPMIKDYAMQIALEGTGTIQCSFDLQTLAKKVHQYFIELGFETELKLVRSTTSLAEDMKDWGFVFSANSNRPYFLGKP